MDMLERDADMNAPDSERLATHLGPLLEQRQEYDQRCVKQMLFTVFDRERALGQNTSKLLYNLLHRSRDLFDGCIHALRGSQVLSTYMTVRAHMETTGCIQYLRVQLHKYYSKSIDVAAVNDIVLRQLLGGRVFPDRNKHPDAPNAVQIMNCVDSVDKAVELKRLNSDICFREIYDTLSEYCHPNFLGHSVGVETDQRGDVMYAVTQSFDDVDLTNVCFGLAASCLVVFAAYDDAMKLLSENEEMPNVEK